MISTRRGFFSSLAGLAAVSSWRIGRSEAPPQGAHDTSPSSATASHRPQSPNRASLADDWLAAWQRLPRLPVMRDSLKSLGETRALEWFTAALILERIRTGTTFGFFYQGGSEPGAARDVLPVLLFSVPADIGKPDPANEPIYLLAHCLKRQAVRTFRLDRIKL